MAIRRIYHTAFGGQTGSTPVSTSRLHVRQADKLVPAAIVPRAASRDTDTLTTRCADRELRQVPGASFSILPAKAQATTAMRRIHIVKDRVYEVNFAAGGVEIQAINVPTAAGNAIRVNSTANLEESGLLLVYFGKDRAFGPIQFTHKLSSTLLLVAPGTAWPSLDLPANAEVVANRTMDAAGTGAILTGTASARNALIQILGESVVAGVQYVPDVIYPSDMGLGAAGEPALGARRLSDIIRIYGDDNLSAVTQEAQDAQS